MLHIKHEHINHCIASILVNRIVTVMSTSRQVFSLKLVKHVYQPRVYNTLLAGLQCQKETPVWGKNKLMVNTDKKQTLYQLRISSCGCCICLQMRWCREGVAHVENLPGRGLTYSESVLSLVFRWLSAGCGWQPQIHLKGVKFPFTSLRNLLWATVS